MEKENQRIALTKRLLKESLLQLLNEKELDAITVTELCRHAGINRATFYRHYQIPRDVLTEMQRELFHQLKKDIPLPTCPEDVQAIIEQLCLFMEKNMELLVACVKSNSDRDFASFMELIYEELWQELSRVYPVYQLNPDTVKMLNLYSTGGTYFLLRSWLLSSPRKSSREIAASTYELLTKTSSLLLSGTIPLFPNP